MSDSRKEQRSEANAELEREIRDEQNFSLEAAIGRMAGPGAMKGESPIPRLQQAEMEIEAWLRSHLTDSGGALVMVLHRAIKDSELLLNNFDEPLAVLSGCCTRVLESEFLLQEIVRAADIEWGRMMGERPHFERPGGASHPDDPYTIESVRKVLGDILKQLSEKQDT